MTSPNESTHLRVKDARHRRELSRTREQIPELNVFVQPTNPDMTEPGLWIQTGLGDGTGMTMWVEDGT